MIRLPFSAFFGDIPATGHGSVNHEGKHGCFFGCGLYAKKDYLTCGRACCNEDMAKSIKKDLSPAKAD